MDNYTSDEFLQSSKPVQTVSINLKIPELRNFAGWATFVAVMDIILGSLSCLAFFYVFPLAIGILQIISGIRLLNAVESFRKYIDTNDPENITSSFISLNKYLKFTGIIRIIGIVTFILVIIGIVAFLVYFASNPQFELPRNFSQSL